MATHTDKTIEIIATYPAYDIIKAPTICLQADLDVEMPVLNYGDTFAISAPSMNKPGERVWRIYTLGSVVGYALAHGDCPITAIDETRQRMKDQPHNGHRLHWARQNSVMISTTPEKHKTHVGLEWDQVIVFEGRNFMISRAPNRNVELIEVRVNSSLTGWEA